MAPSTIKSAQKQNLMSIKVTLTVSSALLFVKLQRETSTPLLPLLLRTSTAPP
jgi:hypothetical protein